MSGVCMNDFFHRAGHRSHQGEGESASADGQGDKMARDISFE